MATGSETNRRVAQQIARLSGRGLTAEVLSRSIMETVREAVPADGYRLFGLDPATRLVNRLLASSENDSWARLEWLRDVYLRTGPLAYIEHDQLTHLNLPAVAVQEQQQACWGYPRNVLKRLPQADHAYLFHEFGCPLGGTILANFSAHGRWVAALQLYRREAGGGFTKAEVALVRGIAQQIGRSISAALALAVSLRSLEHDREASGVLILGPDHCVTMCTPAGEAWLARLNDVEPTGHSPLPTAIWTAIAGLRQANGAPAPTVTVPTQAGLVRIEASLVDAEGSTAVILIPVKPPAPPGVPIFWDLTAQERRIVDLLVQGRGNRDIAMSLFISESTVEWHLRHIYGKLDVRSRSQLIARFFRDTYLPTLAHETDSGPGQ